MKNPLTPAGIEPATFRFVTQHLNHCATAVPGSVGYFPVFGNHVFLHSSTFAASCISLPSSLRARQSKKNDFPWAILRHLPEESNPQQRRCGNLISCKPSVVTLLTDMSQSRLLQWHRSFIVLSSHRRLGPPSGLFPSGFPHQNPVYTSPFPPYVLHSPPILSRFYHPNNTG